MKFKFQDIVEIPDCPFFKGHHGTVVSFRVDAYDHKLKKDNYSYLVAICCRETWFDEAQLVAVKPSGPKGTQTSIGFIYHP